MPRPARAWPGGGCVMSITEARCQLVTALPSWSGYCAEPSGTTLAALLADADANAVRDCIPAALARRFNEAGHWRVAQHIAFELLRVGQSIGLALYYADKALQASGGNPFARLSVARCFWLQRFPDAAIHHLLIARRDAQRFHPASRRADLQAEIADLFANVYCYVGRIDDARPWIERVLVRGGRGDTLIQIFAATFGECPDLELRAARLLVPHLDKLGGRDRSRVQHVLRRHFLATLRART